MESNRHEQEEWVRSTHGMGGNVEHCCFPSYCYGPYPAALPSYGAVYMGMQPMYVPMMGVSYFVPDSLHDQYYERKPDLSRASRRTRIARRRMHESEEPNSPRSQVDQKPAARYAPPLTAVKQEIVTNPPLTSAGQMLAQSCNAISTNTSSELHFLNRKQLETNHLLVMLAISSVSLSMHAWSILSCVVQWIMGLDSKALTFLLAKQLSPSGVSSLGRIVLPKREAEAHLPYLVASEGVLLTMTDFNTRQSWIFRYRFWSNNKSRMYLLENTRDFVKAHNLQERDTLVLYKDADGCYVVRGEKTGANCETSPHEAPTIEEEISRKQQTLEFLI